MKSFLFIVLFETKIEKILLTQATYIKPTQALHLIVKVILTVKTNNLVILEINLTEHISIDITMGLAVTPLL